MITQRQIAEITKKIVDHFQPEKIILFGSYAYGKPSRDSDLDLLIIKDSEVPAYVQNRKIRKLVTDFKTPVDIIVKTPYEFELYKDIVGTIVYPAYKFGKVLYDAG
jgi:predicted nucleotidyltransferase